MGGTLSEREFDLNSASPGVLKQTNYGPEVISLGV